MFNFSWRRDCPDLKSKLTEFADSSLIPGWLELKSALTGFSVDQRVAGTQYNYRCSEGFELPDHSNPDQVLTCQGTRAVDTSAVSSCVGTWYAVCCPHPYILLDSMFPSHDV